MVFIVHTLKANYYQSNIHFFILRSIIVSRLLRTLCNLATQTTIRDEN